MGEECKYHVPVVVEKFNVLDCSSLHFFKLKHGLSYEAGWKNLLCKKDLKGNKNIISS